MRQKSVRPSTKLRALLGEKTFLHLPSVYDAIGGRLVQSLGYEATYVGGAPRQLRARRRCAGLGAKSCWRTKLATRSAAAAAAAADANAAP